MKNDLSKFLDFKPYKSTKGEKYMSSKQVLHFKTILLEWKNLLLKEADFWQIYEATLLEPTKLTAQIEKITNYRERKKDLERRIKILEKSDLYKDKAELKKLEQI